MSEKKHPRPSEVEVLPHHESGVRRIIADADGTEYRALSSLAEARKFSDAVVVFEGDYGGQIYVVAHIHQVHCEEETLHRLLSELDALEWNDPEGASLFFERAEVGSGIAGGMGGGIVQSTVWVHERLKAHTLAVTSVLAGHCSTIRQ